MNSGGSEITHQSLNECSARVAHGWDDERDGFECQDGKFIEVLRRAASIRDLDERRTAPRN